MDKDVLAAYDELKKIKRAAPPKKAGRPPKYPWSTLEVGESFVVPAGKGSGLHTTHAGRRLSRLFSKRRLADGSYLVWRIA